MSKADDAKHACMKYHKNNAFLSAIKALPADSTLPKPEGPGGEQMQCILVDPNMKTGAAIEYEEGWQGGCAQEFTKCTFKWQEPEGKDVRAAPRLSSTQLNGP